ncbi:MAG: hypothetical protein RIB60_05965 [Phycisphaerales bacterium]
MTATFRLFDAENGGTQIGTDIIRAVTPSDGLFSESLDFGDDAWNANDQLWLEIEVDGDVLGRQALESTPFALRTRGIITRDLGGGTILVGIGSGPWLFGLTHNLHLSNPFGSSIGLGGNGGAATMLFDSGGDAAGLTPWSYITAPIGTDDLRIGHSGIGDAVTFRDTGAVGIGTVSPQAWLDVRSSETDGTGIAIDQFGSGLTIGLDSIIGSGFAVRGETTSESGTTYGVYGTYDPSNTSSWGVFSNGRMAATGTKSFCIDHPLDPANAMLLHYSSEAPEPLNTYSGTIVLGADGRAVVRLPDYFGAINTDHRYQLTAIGAPAPSLHVASKIAGNAFVVAGGPAGLEVSWQVTSRRNDAFVQQRGAPVEVQKPEGERGLYLTPELYGQPAERGVFANSRTRD